MSVSELARQQLFLPPLFFKCHSGARDRSDGQLVSSDFLENTMNSRVSILASWLCPQAVEILLQTT